MKESPGFRLGIRELSPVPFTRIFSCIATVHSYSLQVLLPDGQKNRQQGMQRATETLTCGNRRAWMALRRVTAVCGGGEESRECRGKCRDDTFYDGCLSTLVGAALKETKVTRRDRRTQQPLGLKVGPKSQGGRGRHAARCPTRAQLLIVHPKVLCRRCLFSISRTSPKDCAVLRCTSRIRSPASWSHSERLRLP